MSLKEKSILVTGGTGFIGSFIVNKLMEEDCFVNIIVNSPKQSIWRLDNKNQFRIFDIDLRNFSDLKKAIDIIKPSYIFHLAGFVNPERDIENIGEAFSINFGGTKNLILALNEYDYQLFINTGTSDVYGNNKAPFKETLRENPVSPYSASKVASTYFCEMNANTYKKPIITVRPFLPYGPKQMTRRFLPSLIYSGILEKELLLTACEQTRDFIYIEDVAEAYILLAKNAEKVKIMGIFNIGTGKETKILEVVNLIREYFNNTKFLIGKKPYRIGETMHFYSSINKIKKAINWEPKWTLEDGINKTIQWWKNNREIWVKYKNIWV